MDERDEKAERTPVIVGVGQVNDRPDRPEDGLDPIGLMAAALRRADADAGGGLLAQCDSLAVVSQLAWPQLNPVDGKLAQALGIAPAHSEQTAMPNGDSPIRLLHEAANRIGAGEARICAVVGAEALRTAAQLAAAKAKAGDDKPNALRDASHRRRVGYAQSHGLTVPVDVYPLYENAGRAAYGQSLDEGQAESGALWAGMSAVAAQCEHAWIREAVAPEAVVAPSERNRPLAFPYTKLQVANSSVNQGAGFLVASLAEARRRGIPEERLIHIGHGAAAHEHDDFLQRDSYAASPGLTVSIMRTLELNGVTTADLDHVELYSCFPCVPKMARRVLNWPLDRPITRFGGLTFGGGPIGNYMSHALACMVETLRETRGRGLLFANGGYATHNHTILLSAEPTQAQFPQDFDYQAEADDLRGPIPPLDESYCGEATIETYTVHYARDGAPRLGTVVARTPAGARTLASVPPGDRATLDLLTSGAREPVGSAGMIVADESPEDLRRWVPDPN
ncbi:acetyl-CoA acetyltransferase [Erythrobacter sp. QSSC1-22B]|uniref:acetyl-CoA acetyltransferase n=1 Tax=Erythrobacter sp. QSSC1-22B TaxID=1860125 RepID=UPI0008052438|nr:acetyl-CoA acetyltransferase [Erythrobacter sp. QSSC1-22B]OBX19541.1 acetyl-CoA acetyltransferase [Erythrobacter sp. QSSC1-22B]